MKRLLERVFSVGLLAAIVAVVTISIPTTQVAHSDQLEVQADSIDCVNLYKPYPIVIPPNADSIIEKIILERFANHIDKQVDEIYRRVRDAICNMGANLEHNDCAMMRTDTIQACTWPDTCDTGDPQFRDQDGDGAPTITLNTQVLQLLAKPIDLLHSDEPCHVDTGGAITGDSALFLETPVIRFRGPYGDTMDITTTGYYPSSSDGGQILNKYRNYFLPEETMSNRTVWRFNQSGGDTNNAGGIFLGKPYPMPGLMQGGTCKNVNTSMTRDTIVFATAFSHTHGGSHNGSNVGFVHNRGSDGTNRAYYSGSRYSTSRSYSIILNWADGSTNYFQDSLWIVSANDSSFIVGIQYSATARKLNWQTIGWHKDNL